ncbi:hypothetical protein [Chitinilyticum aquatile]|uniref:hypothetical protein n=1 Tax=Chitinilyticum aquatile TaxID=362520 RepID=UPI0003F5672D|nr:hypothetical protein [Chitinilyticum aquatile]
METVTLRRAGWSDQAAAETESALNGDPLASVAEFREWVEAGAAVLFEFHAGPVRIGSAMVTASRVNGHNQAVIVTGASRATPEQFRQAMRLLVEHLNGFDSIRTHIQRPGLKRLYEALGFEQTEIVMRRSNGKPQQ